MVAKSPLVGVFAALLAVACSRTPEPAQVAALAAAAPSLLSQAVNGEIERSQWPAGIAGLEPEHVRVAPEGLYVVLSSVGVEEHGLFVARAPSFAASPVTDPSYTALGQGVFSYHVKG